MGSNKKSSTCNERQNFKYLLLLKINMGNILPTSGAAVWKAGANFSGDISNDMTNNWISGAESIMNTATRFNWSDSFSSLDDDVKNILNSTVENLVAIDMITYDMSGYSSRGEAESMITVLRDSILRNFSILRDIKSQTFLGA